jgi:hypothetical protein
LRIDSVDAEILEADRIRCSHDPTLTDVIIFSWILTPSPWTGQRSGLPRRPRLI